MTNAKRWNVEIFIDEHDTTTRAEARLQNRDRTGVVGVGVALRSPLQSVVPEIGDEIAVSRALTHLAQLLLDAAVADIHAIRRDDVSAVRTAG